MIFIYVLLSMYVLYSGLLYLVGFVTAFIEKKKPEIRNGIRYAVVIPAHNEQKVISNLMSDLYVQSYDVFSMQDVYVLADKCTDNTVTVASAYGVNIKQYSCGGKQKILKQFFAENELERYDYIVILDADNRIKEDYLEGLSGYCNGLPVQTYLDIANIKHSWVSRSYMVNYRFMAGVVQRARARLGLTAFLGGTGCAIPVGDAKNLKFETLVDDLENTVSYVLAGKRVQYAGSVHVYDEKPLKFQDSFKQRLRWMRGTFSVLRLYGKELLTIGLGCQKWRLLEMAFYLSTYVLGVLFLPLTFLALIKSFFSLLIGQFLYYLFVLVVDRDVPFREILSIPIAVVFNLSNYLILPLAFFTQHKKIWVRTPHVGL